MYRRPYGSYGQFGGSFVSGPGFPVGAGEATELLVRLTDPPAPSELSVRLTDTVVYQCEDDEVALVSGQLSTITVGER